jgi:hypothetical protein
MPLITRRLWRGFTPRRFIGISGFTTAHWISLSQYSFAIDPLPTVRELESGPFEPQQALIGFGA